MRKLIRRALKSLDRLDYELFHTLVQELVKDNEQLEMVLSSIPGGVIVSAEGHRISMINTPAQRLLPLNFSDPADHIVWEAIASVELSAYIREALEGDRGAPMKDFSIQHPKRQLILSCGVLPLVDRGSIRGNMVYIEDLTQVRNEEARLKRMESLASLTTMAAGVAHEIKNPLASMSIHLQLMNRKLQSKHLDIKEIREAVSILEEETGRLNNILSDYLFTLRPPESHLNPGNINILLQELLQFLRFEFEEASVKTVLLLDKSIPLMPIDESSMKRALLNLIKNALEAMPDGGELKLETRKEKEGISIEIADTGMGIAKDIQGKIFEPYFTTRDSGSGLGLTVVYKVVREHGGDLHMDSHPGRGTIFRIMLPLLQSEKKLLEGGNT